MQKTIFQMIYLSLLGISVLIGLTVNSFFSAWMSLELNMMVFVCCLMMAKPELGWESGFKYFVVQGAASALFMFAFLINWSSVSAWVSEWGLILCFLMKLGAAPFHAWFLNLVMDISWDLLFILSTVQKIVPYYLFVNVCSGAYVWVIWGSVVSTLGALGQANTKKVLGYSSLFTLSWMLSVQEFLIGGLFIAGYSLALGVVLFVLSMINGNMVKESLGKPSLYSSVLLMMGFMSMAGIPPFVGFFAKLTILQSLVAVKMHVLALLLTQSAVIFLYVYLQMFMTSLSWGSPVSLLMNEGLGLLGVLLASSVVATSILFMLLHSGV